MLSLDGLPSPLASSRVLFPLMGLLSPCEGGHQSPKQMSDGKLTILNGTTPNSSNSTYIYVYFATHDDVEEGRSSTSTAIELAAGKSIVKVLEVQDWQNGAFYMAITFTTTTTTDSQGLTREIIYVGPKLSNPTPSLTMVREVYFPALFSTVMTVYENGVTLNSTLMA